MVSAYVGLGANLGDPPAQIEQALSDLARGEGMRLVARSALYRSPPLGPRDQPDFCNAACTLETGRSPEDLLAHLLALERRAGRERGQRWGPRRLDLDLLHVDGATRRVPGLRLPHPEIAHRGFVLVPLAQIAPSLVIPGVGAVAELGDPRRWPEVRPWSAHGA